MKQDYPKWIYHKIEEPMIVDAPPYPEGYGTWDEIFGKEDEKLENLYETFSKAELIAYAEDLGLTVDTRNNKASIISQIEANA